ncbi:hypothetical protein CRG98_012324 [Punica granatum]|uniref:Uncharacterized protein n=1 Tax=Punica granatum TaxID=22663 RepID=A0A2I0KFP6_PUNGR|nr:hypothetical protein CRG98_012324 [Punica granatum]
MPRRPLCIKSLGPTKKIEREGRVGATNWQSRHLHRDYRRPLWTPASSVGAGDLGGGIGVANWRPQPRIDRGLRVGGLRSVQGWGRESTIPTPTPTPPPRLSASSVGSNDLGGGVGVANRRINWGLRSASSVGTDNLGGGVKIADWRPRPLIPFRFSL